VVGFEIVGKDGFGTDWPKKLSFPVFLLNTLNYLGGNRDPAARGQIRAGDTVTVSRQIGADRVTVLSPSGRGFDLQRDALDTFSFVDTQELGVYQVVQAGETLQQFAVNLFGSDPSAASSESNLRPREITIGRTRIEGRTALEPTRREGWKILLLFALAVLLVEWYIYNRRVYI
jgi:hypothetical protein